MIRYAMPAAFMLSLFQTGSTQAQPTNLAVLQISASIDGAALLMEPFLKRKKMLKGNIDVFWRQKGGHIADAHIWYRLPRRADSMSKLLDCEPTQRSKSRVLNVMLSVENKDRVNVAYIWGSDKSDGSGCRATMEFLRAILLGSGIAIAGAPR